MFVPRPPQLRETGCSGDENGGMQNAWTRFSRGILDLSLGNN